MRCRASTPGHVLMGKKMVESRRSSAVTLRQTTIEMTTPEIEEELRTLAEEDEETKSNSSDSGISKTGSERMVEEDRQTVRSVRSSRSSGKRSTKSGGAVSVRSKNSIKNKADSIEEDIRDEKEPEGMMETDDDRDADEESKKDDDDAEKEEKEEKASGEAEDRTEVTPEKTLAS